MDIDFQDKIDKYLLHGDEMSEYEKQIFFKEIANYPDKKEQYELTCNIKDAINSREGKLKVTKEFQQRYEYRKKVASMRPAVNAYYYPSSDHSNYNTGKRKSPLKNILLWISSIAAILVIGFFGIDLLLNNNVGSAPMTIPEQPQNDGIDYGISPESNTKASPIDSDTIDTVTIPGVMRPSTNGE